MAPVSTAVATDIVFAAFGLVLFGCVLVFAAYFDRHRVRRIEQDPSRSHQPLAARRRWRR